MGWVKRSSFAALIFSSLAGAADIDNDFYVILYKRRVELAEARRDFAKERLGRAETGFQRGVSSAEDLSAHRLEMAVAKLVVKEAEALLDICKTRRENGLDMPIYQRE